MSSSRSTGRETRIRARSAHHQRSQTNTYYLLFDLSRTVFVRSPRVISYGHRKSDICDPESGTCDATGPRTRRSRGQEILENDDYRGSSWTGSSPWTAATPPDRRSWPHRLTPTP